ncbi:low density lipoprotein receptor adapter protein 1-like isoform X2 [Lycorma delicatula]
MPDALSFTVKYLGSTIVSNNTTATAAVDTILTMAKVAKRKKYQVTVMVTLNGVMVSDPKTGSLIFDASIYRISNVSTDPVRRNIFTFFATNKYDITECHAFQCPKRKMAQTVTLTVAHSFKTAYEVWQRGHQMCTKIMEQKAETEKIQNEKNIDIQLIDLSERNEVSSDVSNNWVRFETDKEENSEELTYNRHIQLLQPPEKSKTGNSTKITSEFGNFADNFIWTNNLQ